MTRDSASEAANKRKLALLQKDKETLEASITRLKREKFALASQLHLQEQALHANLTGWIIWKAGGSGLEMSFPWKKVLGEDFEEAPDYDTLMRLMNPADRFSIRRINWALLHGVISNTQKVIYVDCNSSNHLPVLVKASILPDENGQAEAIAFHVSVQHPESPTAQEQSGFNLNQLPLPLIRVRSHNGEPVFLNSLAWKIIIDELGEAEIQHISEFIGGDTWLLLQEKIKEGNLSSEIQFSLEGKSDFLLFARVSGSFMDLLLVDISTLRDSINELQQVNMQLDNFVYHASHDLRAPLRTVLGLLDLVRIETKTEQRDRCVNLIEGSVKRLDSLVVDLLSISRNRQATFSLAKVNFMVEVDQAVSSFYHLGKTKNLEIRTFIKQPVSFMADLTRIRVILNNVISNAIKYRRYNVFPSFIEVRIKVDEKAALIELEDNGEGIPPDKLDSIFNMFYRASESSEGSGLGLYIVHDVVKKLKGSIEVKSTLGQGTQFDIMIPNRR